MAPSATAVKPFLTPEDVIAQQAEEIRLLRVQLSQKDKELQFYQSKTHRDIWRMTGSQRPDTFPSAAIRSEMRPKSEMDQMALEAQAALSDAIPENVVVG